MRFKIILVLVALALVAAGCGDDDDATTTTAAAAGDTTTTAAAETTTTAAAETTTTAAAAACAVESLELITPGTLTVATGEPAFPPWVGTGTTRPSMFRNQELGSSRPLSMRCHATRLY